MRRLRGKGVRGAAAGLPLALLLLACGPGEPTPSFEMLAYPLPVDVDGQTHRSSILLEGKLKRYELPFEEFEERQLEAREEALAAFVRAVRSSDYGAVAQMVYGREPWEAEVARVAVDTWRDSFGFFDEITVVAQAALAGRGVFILEWPGIPGAEGALNRFAFTVRDLPDERFRVRYVDRADPLEFQYLYVFRKLWRDPEGYAPVTHPDLPFAYPLVIDEGAPVWLRFRGEILRVDMSDADARIENPVARFYRDSALAFMRGEWESFLAGLSPVRRRAAEMWRERTPPANVERARAQSARGEIRFVLDGDPVFVVFSAKETPGSGARLGWEYLLRDAESQEIQLASRNLEEPFDQLLAAFVPTDPDAFEARLERRTPGGAGDSAP